jgi:serine/threonine-protein kinase
MSLQPGSSVGVYQIVAPIGAGGMGEVYRARDTRLNRQVALKVLPDEIARDHDRVSRFSREAQLLAALNHPNIAAIYGVEDAGSGLALVLEYIDGETLAERMKRGPLPLEEVLRIALQIGAALEAAHDKAVIHRDLKPANVKITSDGMVKVLDFGLAKALEQDLAAPANLSLSPTLSLAATGAGMILGTAGYMAPEQARGLTVDRRTDIWAYGVVLFEMLSSRPLFEGQTVADTIANVLQREPDWKQLPAGTPATLRTLVRRCLVKNPKERLQAIGDARILLEETAANPGAAEMSDAPPVYPLWKKLLPWALAPLFLVAGWFIRPSAATPERQVAAFDLVLPPAQFLAHNYRHAVAMSPDGRRLAWIARLGEPSAPPSRIFVRAIDRVDSVALPGTEGAQEVTFSPDGGSVAFQAGRQIRKVAVGGGAPVVLVDRLDSGTAWGPPGLTWGRNGDIVFETALGVGLSVVRDSGGEPQVFTTLDDKAQESSHRLPHFLPDGNAVLFTVLRYTNITPDWKRAQVWVKPLKGDRKLLLEDAMDARYAGDGVLVFARQGKLFAVRFDPQTLSVSGMPVQVLDNVTHALYGNAAITWSGAAQYSVAENGTLLYAPGSIEPPFFTALTWIDRTGRETPVASSGPMARFAPRVLPDNRRVAFSELYVGKDIRVLDTTLGTQDRASYEGQNAFPIWSRDGKQMAFRSDRSGPLAIYLTSDLDFRKVTQLTSGPMDVPSSWAPDNRTLVFTRGFSATGGNTDIYVVSTDRPQEARALVASPANESFPEISPDGTWLAYISDESGRAELYVQPFNQPGRRVTVTSGGATEPAWSPKGGELFYRNGDRSIMSVSYTAGADFVPEKPVQLFQYRPAIGGTSVRASYDVAPDGRFLVNQAVLEAQNERNRQIFPSSLRAILNWTSVVERTLSAP